MREPTTRVLDSERVCHTNIQIVGATERQLETELRTQLSHERAHTTAHTHTRTHTHTHTRSGTWRHGEPRLGARRRHAPPEHRARCEGILQRNGACGGAGSGARTHRQHDGGLGHVQRRHNQRGRCRHDKVVEGIDLQGQGGRELPRRGRDQVAEPDDKRAGHVTVYGMGRGLDGQLWRRRSESDVHTLGRGVQHAQRPVSLRAFDDVTKRDVAGIGDDLNQLCGAEERECLARGGLPRRR